MIAVGADEGDDGSAGGAMCFFLSFKGGGNWRQEVYVRPGGVERVRSFYPLVNEEGRAPRNGKSHASFCQLPSFDVCARGNFDQLTGRAQVAEGRGVLNSKVDRPGAGRGEKCRGQRKGSHLYTVNKQRERFKEDNLSNESQKGAVGSLARIVEGGVRRRKGGKGVDSLWVMDSPRGRGSNWGGFLFRAGKKRRRASGEISPKKE